MTNPPSDLFVLVLLGVIGWGSVLYVRFSKKWLSPSDSYRTREPSRWNLHGDHVATCFCCKHLDFDCQITQPPPPAILFTCTCRQGHFRLVNWRAGATLAETPLAFACQCPGFHAREIQDSSVTADSATWY